MLQERKWPEVPPRKSRLCFFCRHNHNLDVQTEICHIAGLLQDMHLINRPKGKINIM